MFKWLSYALSAASLFAIKSCTGFDQSTILYEGQYKGAKLEIKNVVKKNIINKKISQSIRIGKLRELEISEFTTNWGMPYADDIYGKASRIILTHPC